MIKYSQKDLNIFQSGRFQKKYIEEDKYINLFFFLDKRLNLYLINKNCLLCG